MGTLKELAGLKLMHQTARTKLRQVRPSRWADEGLKLPKSGKWASFWVTHTDLVAWAGGEVALCRRFTFSEDAQEYLWRLFEREVGHVYGFFSEVMEPNPTRLMDWCDSRFESHDFLLGTAEV